MTIFASTMKDKRVFMWIRFVVEEATNGIPLICTMLSVYTQGSHLKRVTRSVLKP